MLEKRMRILGEEHPYTISAMGDLANTLGNQGQLDEALHMMRRVVLEMNRILGAEHPKTRIAKANLAAIEAQKQLPTTKAQAKRGLKRRFNK